MDKHEATQLLDETLDRFRQEPYESLTARIDADPLVKDFEATAGSRIRSNSNLSGTTGLTVTCESSARSTTAAVVPLTRSLIKAADGRFVGE